MGHASEMKESIERGGHDQDDAEVWDLLVRHFSG